MEFLSKQEFTEKVGVIEKKVNDEIYSRLTAVAYDVDTTPYIAGQKVDIETLKTIQAKKYASFMRKLRKGEVVTITCVGTSITYGWDTNSADKRPADTTACSDGSVHVATRAGKTYTEALQEALEETYGATKVKVINRGYEGDYAKSSLTRWRTRHEGDLTIIEMGTNDSRHSSCPYVGNIEEYIYWMEQLIIKELLWGKAIVLVSPIKVMVASDVNVNSFAHALELLAEKYNIPLVCGADLVAGYSSDIHSDVTHFNTKGYTVIGEKLASCFIGEGIAKPMKISSGSVLLTRPMIDNVYYGENALYYSASTTETPDETGTNKGIFAKISHQGNLTYSIYNELDNLVIFPSFLLFSGAKLKISIDYNVGQAQRSLDSTYLKSKSQYEDLPTFVEYSGITVNNKMYMLNNGIEPLILQGKGWHTITVNSTGADTYFYGLEFMSYQDYHNMKNAGTIKETLLFTGSVNSGTVTLLDDITKYKHILIQTGSISSLTLTTSLCRSFGTANFRVGSDMIRVSTATGNLTARVTNNKELTIDVCNDPIRNIWGLNEYIL